MKFIKQIYLRQKAFNLLSREYPDFVRHNDIEKILDDDFNQTKNY